LIFFQKEIRKKQFSAFFYHDAECPMNNVKKKRDHFLLEVASLIRS